MNLRERLVREEDGAVLVTVALWLPLLVILMAFVLDVGNWFVHKRHLQIQADAAALAAAQDYRFPCDDVPIKATALNYGKTLNPQIGGTLPANVTQEINTTSDATGSPCADGFVDVQMTEQGSAISSFFGLVSPASIKAHARVSLFQVSQEAGLRPIFVEDPNPKTAKVTFINEANGNVLASADLEQGTSAGGMNIWQTPAASPASLAIPNGVKDVGMRVALSGGTTTNCSDAFVVCYDAGSANGIVHVRGYSTDPVQNNNPAARDVQLTPGSCGPDSYFTDGTACTMGVNATIDFGTNNPANGATVKATVGGTDYPLTWCGTGSGTCPANTWQSASTVPVPAGGGPVNVGLSWKLTQGTVGTGNNNSCSQGNGCSGDFGTVQRTFSATNARSGPIGLAQIGEVSQSTFGADSFAQCPASGVTQACTHSLTVKLGVTGALANAQNGQDKLVQLRVAVDGQDPGNGRSPNCDPAKPPPNNLNDQLRDGCAPTYAVNTGQACPAGYNDPTVTPWRCVGLFTGNRTNQVPVGLNDRIIAPGNQCTLQNVNKWNTATSPGDLNPNTDRRFADVFLMPFGSLRESGQTLVPISGFANFYITGWIGSGSGQDPCVGSSLGPRPGDDPSPDKGTIVGHFVKTVKIPTPGTGGTQPCNPSALAPCFAQLTQ